MYDETFPCVMYPLGKTNQYLWRLSLISIISRVNCQGGGVGWWLWRGVVVVEGEWWLWRGSGGCGGGVVVVEGEWWL